MSRRPDTPDTPDAPATCTASDASPSPDASGVDGVHDGGTQARVFAGLRTGLHVLVVGLVALVVVRALVTRPAGQAAALALSAAFLGVYGTGVRRARPAQAAPTAPRGTRGALVWLAVLTAVWVGLVVIVPEAAYLVFPLFFLYLHVLPHPLGPLVVVASTGVAVLALGLHSGFTLGGVVGPCVGAGVALLLGLGFRALTREARQREQLLAELVATRDRLAATEREQGVLAERGRLAREIHDTVAQGLSSIQMLLHAAERADGERPGIEHIRLARSTAADSLADTRRFIRELTPPDLDRGLAAALQRLASGYAERDGLVVEVTVPDGLDLPMDVQTAVLRVAQSALANVVQHATASSARIEVAVDARTTRLTVSDDGRGFDARGWQARSSGTDSFGLRAMSERAEQLGGTFAVQSVADGGTTLTLTLPREAP